MQNKKMQKRKEIQNNQMKSKNYKLWIYSPCPKIQWYPKSDKCEGHNGYGSVEGVIKNNPKTIERLKSQKIQFKIAKIKPKKQTRPQ